MFFNMIDEKDFSRELACITDECKKYIKYGKVADYIPELAKADINKLCVYIISKDTEYFSGDYDTLFTIQSIIKPLILLKCQKIITM